MADSKLKNFSDFFPISINTKNGESSIALSQQVFHLMRIFEYGIKKQKIEYNDFGIKKLYYRDFRDAIVIKLQEIAKDLQKISTYKACNHTCTSISYLDFAVLNYFKILFKSSLDNRIVTIKDLNFKSRQLLNECLIDIENILNKRKQSKDNYENEELFFLKKTEKDEVFFDDKVIEIEDDLEINEDDYENNYENEDFKINEDNSEKENDEEDKNFLFDYILEKFITEPILDNYEKVIVDLPKLELYNSAFKY